MVESKENKKLKYILSNLKSTDTKKVIDAISQLRKYGTPATIQPILELHNSTKNDEISSAITSFLYDVKDEKVVDVLINTIEDNLYPNQSSFLLSIFWQSSLDASEHITAIVKCAIQGDYLTCLEALTVIENFEGEFDEAVIQDILFDLQEAFEQEESDKAQLLNSIHQVVQGLPRQY